MYNITLLRFKISNTHLKIKTHVKTRIMFLPLSLVIGQFILKLKFIIRNLN